MESEIKRKIYYYDLMLSVRQDEINSKGRKRSKCIYCDNPQRTIYKVFEEIKKKQEEISTETNDKKRNELQDKFQMQTSQGFYLYVLVDRLEMGAPIRFKLVLCKDNSFPFVQKNGKLEYLIENLQGEFALAEITHCVIFPDKMIMGAEFNFSGARPSAIANYISYKSSDVYYMDCHGKINNESIDKIVEGSPYSLFDLKIKNTERIKELIESNKFAFTAWLRKMPEDISDYEIILRKRKTSKNRGFEPPLTKDEYRELVKNYREEIGRLKISQGIMSDSIDLLNLNYS